MPERISKEDAAYEIDRIVGELNGVQFNMVELKAPADINNYLHDLAELAKRLRA